MLYLGSYHHTPICYNVEYQYNFVCAKGITQIK
jgi:hypothetical protein